MKHYNTATVTSSLLCFPCLQLCFHVCMGWTGRQHKQTVHGPRLRRRQSERVLLPTHVLVLAFC